MDEEVFDGEMPVLIAQGRMAENQLYEYGDEIDLDGMSYDRLVFLLVTEKIRPATAWADLPEPLFTDVMVARD